MKKLESQKKASLTIDDKTIELPVIIGSENEIGIDISQLRAETGAITVDNAFVNTAATTSAITFLDGENGILRYRGYPIEELAAHASFPEVAFLLLKGEKPDTAYLQAFEKNIAKYKDTNDNIKKIIQSFPSSAHPMGILSSCLVALSAFHEDLCIQDLNKDQIMESSYLLMAQIKNICAYIFRHQHKQPFISSDTSLSYCDDFYHMMFGQKPAKEISKALNVLLILHADHEQNCSTSSVRLVGSSKANPFASIASGINALWGPLHGGANQAVIEMLEQIHKAGGNYKFFIDKAKDKNDAFVLMGFGHRVYRNFDPRATIIKKTCDDLLSLLGVKDPLLDIAKGLEKEALSDNYFIQRKLYPNVDFYSGIIYKALNIPTNMFTAMFALGRLPGWLAQWKELLESNAFKIGRPRQIYTGPTKRSYKP